MFKNKRILLVLSLVMALAVFTGCQSTEEETETEAEEPVVVEEETEAEEMEEEEEIEDGVALADWDGSWNNMAHYLDHEELETAFEELGEREGISADEAREAYLEDRKINFNGLIVDGNTVTFLDEFEEDDGELVEEKEYEYQEMVTAKHGNFDTEWYAFKATEDGAYNYLLLMPVHGEEALTHFHLRYGDSVEEVLALEDWYPTFINPNSTYDQIYEEITE